MRFHLIIGPTGVGKTAHSIRLARQLNCPVVVLDRFQVFNELATGTGRPSAEECTGTERHYLTRRRVAEGELSADESLRLLAQLIWHLSRGPECLILEGGSIALCSKLFDSGLLHGHEVRMEHLTVANSRVYRARVQRRVEAMLTGFEGHPSMMEELAALWNKRSHMAFVETIAGYDAVVLDCRRSGRCPGERIGEVPEAPLIEAVVAAHLTYAAAQQRVFQALTWHFQSGKAA
jgi:hypothetical protein